ncbi:hypothetical protein LMJ43_37845, partial [Streptomyces rochei]|nr:hypothetical protein [Streptomyces rochei]
TGVLNKAIYGDPEKAAAAAQYIAARLDTLADEVERGWVGQYVEGQGFQFERTVRGGKDTALIDDAFLGSVEARKLDEYTVKLQDVFARPGKLRRKDAEHMVYGPVDLFEAVTHAGRMGFTRQRYTGLGEMNPEQLWET